MISRQQASKTMLRATAMLAAMPIAVALPAIPAHATGGGVGSFQECQAPLDEIQLRLARCVSGTITVQVAGGPGVGLALVTFQCAVQGVGDVASTRVDRCGVAGVDGLSPIEELPGLGVAQAGAAILSTGMTYEACVGGTAYFLDDTSVDGSDCNPITINL